MHCGKISWGDCKFVLNASTSHPPDFLRAALAKMEAAWDDDALRKLSVNAMIGLWCIPSDTAFFLRSSFCEDDLKAVSPGQALKIRTEFAEGRAIHDYVFQTSLISGGLSMRPLHDLCIQQEAVRVAQMIAIIQKLGCPQRSIFQFSS